MADLLVKDLVVEYSSGGYAVRPIIDPTALGEGREAKLAAYRQARDQIKDRMIERFGPPTAA